MNPSFRTGAIAGFVAGAAFIGVVLMILAQARRHLDVDFGDQRSRLDALDLRIGELAQPQVLAMRLDQHIEAILLIVEFEQPRLRDRPRGQAPQTLAFLLGDLQLALALVKLHLAGLE